LKTFKPYAAFIAAIRKDLAIENVLIVFDWQDVSELTEGYTGYNDNKPFDIYVNPALKKERMFFVLAHELCHVWQFSSGYLKTYPYGKTHWMGYWYTMINAQVAAIDKGYEAFYAEYQAQPWESHANAYARYAYELFLPLNSNKGKNV